MTLDELINKIDRSAANEINVERLQVSLGNPGGAGHYGVVKLRIGKDELVFKNSCGTWVTSS